MSNLLKFRWVPTDSESHRNGPADIQDKGHTNYALRICQGSYPYILLRSFPHSPNKCILEYVSGRKKVKIPWGKICEDPSSWIQPECVPNGFQWADPSKIRIGDIFPLFEHWREQQKHHLSPLIWVPTCPFLRNASPSFEDWQQYNSNNSIPSSSSDDDNSEFSSHEQCYSWTSLIRRYIGLHRFFSHSPTPKPMYDTISCVSCVRYDLESHLSTIRSLGSFLYDINLGATATTILRIRGVQIPIDLVSSATDSYRRSVVLFKLMSVPTSDLKSEFLCQSSHIAQNIQIPLNHLVCLGHLPHPRHHVSPVLSQSECSHQVPEAEAPFTMG